MRSELFKEAIGEHNPLYKEGFSHDQFYKGAEWAWQHQQSKIDELQANYDQHDQWLGQRNKDVQELSDIIAKHAAENAELQKRVDAALKMISINRGFAWMPESISQLEQALKGESNG